MMTNMLWVMNETVYSVNDIAYIMRVSEDMVTDWMMEAERNGFGFHENEINGTTFFAIKDWDEVITWLTRRDCPRQLTF